MRNRIGLSKERTTPTVAKNEEVLAKPLRHFAVSRPGDRSEQEAERIADHVTGTSSPPTAETPGTVQRTGAGVSESNVRETAAPGDVLQDRGPGRPLDPSTRAFMEARLGHDFSRVRIHADERANDAARGLNARAFTYGRDIVFGAGQHAPGTAGGKKLLAHELVHVAQQQRAGSSGAGGPVVMRAPVTPEPGKPVEQLSLSTSNVPRPVVTRTPAGIAATVYFEKDGIFLNSANLPAVAQLADELSSMHKPVVMVDGHASKEGDAGYNERLSEMRRQLVISILGSKTKETIRFAGMAYGETTPAAPETAKDVKELESQRALNRRVEIMILTSPGLQPASEPQTAEKKPDLKLPPPKPETPEERLNRILKEKPPEPRKRQSLHEAVRKILDEKLEEGLSKIGVPKEYRGYIKDAARGAIEKGAWEVLDKALDGAGVKEKDKDMIKKIIEGVSKEPLL